MKNEINYLDMQNMVILVNSVVGLSIFCLYQIPNELFKMLYLTILIPVYICLIFVTSYFTYRIIQHNYYCIQIKELLFPQITGLFRNVILFLLICLDGYLISQLDVYHGTIIGINMAIKILFMIITFFQHRKLLQIAKTI